MHLQTVDKDHRHLHYKVWLESRGRRVVQPEPGIPAKALKVLREEISRQRGRIEAHWASFMIKNDWLKARLSGTTITLHAYPNTPNHFERTIEVGELIRDKETARKLTAKDVALNEEYAFLELFPQRDEANRVHEPLPEILWLG